MRDVISASSPQWVHVGLRLHPLPLLAKKERKIKAFGAYKKSLMFSHKWRQKWPVAKKIWARGGLRVIEKNLFKKQFKLKKKILLKNFILKQHPIPEFSLHFWIPFRQSFP